MKTVLTLLWLGWGTVHAAAPPNPGQLTHIIRAGQAAQLPR